MARIPPPSVRLVVAAAALALGVFLADRFVAPAALRRGRTGGVPVASKLAEFAREELARVEAGVPDDGMWAFDADLGWSLRPGTVSDVGSTNRLGARGPREYDLRPPPGRLRIVCFGESFVFGHEVADDETWEARLEALDERLEVLNFGVSGYGVDQSLLRFRSVGRDLGAEVAVLGLNVTSIGRNVNRLRLHLRPEHPRASVKPRFRLGATGELELVPLPFRTEREVLEAALAGELIPALAEHEHWSGGLSSAGGSPLGDAMTADGRSGRRTMGALWRDAGGEPFRLTLEIVAAFDAEARAAGARRVVVLFFPVEKDLDEVRDGGRPAWARFQRALRRRHIEVVELEDALVEAAAREPIYALLHLDAAGNAAVAARLLDWMGTETGLRGRATSREPPR